MKKYSLKQLTKKVEALKKLESKKIKGGAIIIEEVMLGLGHEDVIVF